MGKLEGGALINGISAFLKVAQRNSFIASLLWRWSWTDVIYRLESGSFTDKESTIAFILRCPGSWTMRIHFCRLRTAQSLVFVIATWVDCTMHHLWHYVLSSRTSSSVSHARLQSVCTQLPNSSVLGKISARESCFFFFLETRFIHIFIRSSVYRWSIGRSPAGISRKPMILLSLTRNTEC